MFFALGFLAMVHMDYLKVDLGGAIDFAALYILVGIYLVYSLLSYYLYPTLSLSGSLSWLAAMIDVFGLCLAIYFSGGVESYTFLFFGVVPLVGGMYGEYRGAVYACLLSLLGFTFIVIFNPQTPPGYNFSQAVAVRYLFIVGATFLDIYIVDLLLKDRRRLKIFYEISQSSSKSPALYNVMKEVTQRIAEILKAEVAVVFMYNEATGSLEAQQPSLGLDYLGTTKLRIDSKDSGMLAEGFRLGEAVLVPRSRAGSRDIQPLSADYNIFDLVACPLVARGRNIGILVLANKLNRRGFKRRDLVLVELLAPHISIFLDNAMLYRRSEEKVAQLTSLIRVVDAIGTVSSMNKLYDLALDVIKGLFAVEKGLINIINRQTGLLETVRSFGYSDEYREKHLDKPFERIEDCYVLKNDSAFLCADIETDNRCPNLVVDEDTRSVLCVPIRSGKNEYGILHMASRYTNAFDEEDATLANAIGEQLGMAVESAQLFEEINRLAITDGLTGLYNVRHLKRVLGEEVRRSLRYSRPLSFIMIDIDFFKYYNDNHGHPRGDEVLRILAGLLLKNTRDVDTVFRYGGEEFSVIIPEVPKQEAYAMAERIRRVVQEHVFPYEEEQPNGNLTVSMGVANLPEDALEGDELVEKADRALYRAKQIGRNQVCLYTSRLDEDVLKNGDSPQERGDKPRWLTGMS